MVQEPWPSRDVQNDGPCTKLQSVLAMEIDTDGVMWVVDSGPKRIQNLGPEQGVLDVRSSEITRGRECPPKVVLIDIPTGDVIHSYEFPDSSAKKSSLRDGSLLTDLVLDVKRKIAYISDSNGPEDAVGGIIVYDLENNRSRRFHPENNCVEKAEPLGSV
ncbi:unnamed protein product [Symbiodinium natans]|uniref:Uncharacterized protein n=1 Tax=Symbiodinium natans TaxID=878477 RepID=A0A812PV30_9DINO|nr:unnamed protein product [Symbiodinium natans]